MHWGLFARSRMARGVQSSHSRYSPAAPREGDSPDGMLKSAYLGPLEKETAQLPANVRVMIRYPFG